MLYTQLRSFHAVATEGGFTAASRRLNVGQPTITSQVRELEAHYKVELFIRRGHRVRLTDAGSELLELSRRIFTLEGDAQDLLRGLGGLQRGQLRVGAVGPYHVTEMLSRFHQAHPAIRLSVAINNSRAVLEQLLAFDVDVAVLAHVHDNPRVTAVPYSRHPVVAFVNRQHPWAARRRVKLADFAGAEMVLREEGSTTRLAFERALAQAGVTVRPVIELGSREMVWLAVERGLGIGVVSAAEFIPHANLVPLPIADSDVHTIAHVAWLKERHASHIVRAFVTLACGGMPEAA
jgi:aminoethylphosphonate catabolism LysR family transcriptional regulator